MAKNKSCRQMYRKHFSKRLFERYGLIATDTLYNEFIRQIQNRNQPTKTRQINRQRSIHCVFYRGKQIFVVYRKGKATLVTALPWNKRYNEMHRQETKDWLRAKNDTKMSKV